MALFAIAVLQLSSPFILLGLLVYWVYQISKTTATHGRKIKALDEDINLLHRRITDTDEGLYKKIGSVEQRVEDLDDILMGVLERESERASKTPSKTK
jgi:hypothetical protein